jgi:hypothetical protein
MRNRDGRYNLMFEEWVTDGPFVISPRITFEVRVGPGRFLLLLGFLGFVRSLNRSSNYCCNVGCMRSHTCTAAEERLGSGCSSARAGTGSQ